MTPAQEAAFDRKAEAWCRGHRPCAMDAYRNGYDRIRWGTPDTNDTGRTDSSPAQSLSDASAVMDAPNHSPAQA